MSDKTIKEEIEVVLDDSDVKKKQKTVGDGFEKMFDRSAAKAVVLNKAMDAGLKLFSALVDEMKKGVDSALEYEKTTLRLSNALTGAGLNAKDLIGGFEAQAAVLQNITGINDEAVRGYQALAVSMGVGVGQVDDFIRAAISMANATGRDVNSAVNQLAKTMGGFAGELGEILPDIKDLTKEQLQSGKAIDLLNEKYGDQLTLLTEGRAGDITGLTNAWGDFTEAIGKSITQSTTAIGVFDSLTRRLSGMALVMEKFGFFTAMAMGKDEVEAFGESLRIQQANEAQMAKFRQGLAEQGQTNKPAGKPTGKGGRKGKKPAIAPLLASGNLSGQDLANQRANEQLTGPGGHGAQAEIAATNAQLELQFAQMAADGKRQIDEANFARKMDLEERTTAFQKEQLEKRMEDQKKFGSVGIGIAQGLAHSMIDAFATMAAGGKVHMGQMMKDFLIATGRMLLARGISTFLSSLWPVNPAGLAAGGKQMAAGAAMMIGSLAVPGGGKGGSQSGGALAASNSPNTGFGSTGGGGGFGGGTGGRRRPELDSGPPREIVIVVDGSTDEERVIQLERAKRGLRQRGIDL